jgi:peptide/nickel transport system permease protein
MLRFILDRLFHTFLVLLAISFITFFIMYKAGDPVQLLLPPDATQAQVVQMRHTLGLDGSFLTQYRSFLVQLSHGNLGTSFVYGEPALKVVMERLPATLELAILAMLLSILIGIPLGVIAAVNAGKWKGKAIMLFSLAGISIPVFWIGMVLVLIFSVLFDLLPSSGRGEVYLFTSALTWDGIRHLIMPVVTLALFQLALIIRLTQSGMREVLTQDYIKFARARGLPEHKVVYGHGLRNALIPLVTVIGLQFGQLIAFTIVTETIFAWPGTGKLIIDSIQNLDRPVVVAYLLVIALIFVVINLIVDLLYTVIDPRMRLV